MRGGDKVEDNPCLKSTMTTPSYTIGIKVVKDRITFKYGVKKTTTLLTNDSMHQVAALPYLLSPIVEKISALPLQIYDLNLKEILPLAILESPIYGTRYLTPLDSRIVLNHWDPIFQTESRLPGFHFSCCKLDDYTIVTFQQDEMEKTRHTI